MISRLGGGHLPLDTDPQGQADPNILSAPGPSEAKRRTGLGDGRLALPLIGAMAFALLLPSFLWGPPQIDSSVYNYVWTKQFGDQLSRGVIYPRWLPSSFGGLGSPTFYFYPPIAFYLSGGLQVAGLSTQQAINGAGFLGLFASGLAMWSWLRLKGANTWWALVYMAAPYHLTDWYQRAALAEFTAFAWLPLIALAIEAQPRRWATPLLAVAYAGLIMTHLPVAVLTSLFLIAPMVARRREHLKLYAVAGALGLALSAIYLLPALALQSHVSMAAMSSSFYQPSTWAPWAENAAIWVVPLALGPLVLAMGRPLFWLGITLLCVAMALAVIPLVWELPVLKQVQFPWRILVVAEFAAVTAVALAPRRAIVIALALAITASAYARIANVAQSSLRQPLPASIDRNMPDAPEYLPAGSYIANLSPHSRVPDLSRATRPTLGPKPVVETVWGGGLSALALFSLCLLAMLGGPKRPRFGRAERNVSP